MIMQPFSQLTFLLIIAVSIKNIHSESCEDKISDCAEYTKESCKPPYLTWAQQNCPAYCGFCRRQCVDNRSDCHEFGISACLPLYKTWAKQNCAAYCGYCGAENKCVYSPWMNLKPCSKTCNGGVVVQVRTFTTVPHDTSLATDCNKTLIRNKACNIKSCTTTTTTRPTTHPSKNHVLNPDPAVNLIPGAVAAGVASGAATAVLGAGEKAVVGAGEGTAIGAGEGAAIGAGEGAAIGAGEGAIIGAGEGAALAVGEGAAAIGGEIAGAAIGETVAAVAGETILATIGEALLGLVGFFLVENKLVKFVRH